MLSSVRSRLGPIARWLAPSAAAACAGALASGVAEGVGADDLGLAPIGFTCLLAIPVLFAIGVIVRALLAGWQPRRLAAELVDADGGAPRLAGWVGVIWLGAFGLAWAAFQGTWLLSAWTAFKPLVVGYGEAVIITAATLVLVVVSRPAARLFGALAGTLDRRWRRRGHDTLLSPRLIFVGAAITAVGAGYVVWRLVVRSRISPFDLSVLRPPLAAIAATLAVHALWRVLGRAGLIVGAAVEVVAVGTMVIAIATLVGDPQRTLEIWGDRSLAGASIASLFDLDAIRDRIPPAAFAPTPRVGAPHPDLVLVVIDSMRADQTPPYNGPSMMPVLRELGVRGAVFSWAFAPSNAAEASIPAIALGVAANRVHLGARLDPRHVVVAERLRAVGYDTAAFVCCAAWRGLDRGFLQITRDADGAALVRAMRAWLAQHEASNRPVFITLHLVEPRDWASAGDPIENGARRITYQRALARSDALLTDVLAGFGRRSPIVIVTSDHGEPLGDHDRATHGTDLYNAQLRVPLVIAGPGVKPQRIDETVSLVDLAPTLVGLAGYVPPATGLDGRSLSELVTGLRASAPEAGTATAFAAKTERTPELATVIRGRWKLYDAGTSYELYDVRNDPDERANVIAQRGSIAMQLRRVLDDARAAAVRSPF